MVAFQEIILFNPASLCTAPVSNNIRRSIELFAIWPHDRWHDDGYGLRSYEPYLATGSYVGVDPGAIETLAMIVNLYTIQKLIPPIRGCGRLVAVTVCFPVQVFTMLLPHVLPEHWSFI